MATGLPCLVTPFLGISAGIGRAGEHYHLVDRNQDAIATALAELLANDELRRLLGKRGQDYVVANIDQQSSLDHYAEFYAELAATAVPRR